MINDIDTVFEEMRKRPKEKKQKTRDVKKQTAEAMKQLKTAYGFKGSGGFFYKRNKQFLVHGYYLVCYNFICKDDALTFNAFIRPRIYDELYFILNGMKDSMYCSDGDRVKGTFVGPDLRIMGYGHSTPIPIPSLDDTFSVCELRVNEWLNRSDKLLESVHYNVTEFSKLFIANPDNNDARNKVANVYLTEYSEALNAVQKAQTDHSSVIDFDCGKKYSNQLVELAKHELGLQKK